MKSYAAALCILFLAGGAAANALMACASPNDIPPTMGFGNTSGGGNTSSSSGGSSGAGMDATTQPTGSSSGYGGDDTSPSSSTSSSGVTTDDGGDDSSGGTVPGPTCTSTQGCVDAIPSGWSGFVQLLVGSGPDAGAPCAAPYNQAQPSLSGQTNPEGGAATCGSCNCVVPDAGVSCSIGIGTGNLLCTTNPPPPQTAAAANACTPISGASGQVFGPSLTSGACQAQPVQVTAPPPPATSNAATACGEPGDAGAAVGDGGAAVGATCSSGQQCADLPAGSDAGTPSGVCVYQAGIQTCPPAGTSVFTNTFVVGAVEDSRGCGCTCGTLLCPDDGYVQAFSNNNCSGIPALTLDAGAACKAFGITESSFKYIPSRSGSLGTCGAATGGPTGAVDIDGGTATTFCCVP